MTWLALLAAIPVVAQRVDVQPDCACGSPQAAAESRNGIAAHQQRSLGLASKHYTAALRLAGSREPSAAERETILRFTPRTFTQPSDPFPLKDAAAVLHPSGEWIAYHYFWEDDIDFPDDNDPCDHEVVWVRLDPARRKVVALYTYFHGRILQAPRVEEGGQRVAVQWGKHGTMPWEWRALRVVADEGDVERKQMRMGGQTLEDYNRATWRKLSTVGREAQDSLLARGWPLKFAGSWQEFTSFTREVDVAARLREGGLMRVSCLNNAVINREFLRYNFAAKTEWPEAMCGR